MRSSQRKSNALSFFELHDIRAMNYVREPTSTRQRLEMAQQRSLAQARGWRHSALWPSTMHERVYASRRHIERLEVRRFQEDRVTDVAVATVSPRRVVGREKEGTLTSPFTVEGHLAMHRAALPCLISCLEPNSSCRLKCTLPSPVYRQECIAQPSGSMPCFLSIWMWCGAHSPLRFKDLPPFVGETIHAEVAIVLLVRQRADCASVGSGGPF